MESSPSLPPMLRSPRCLRNTFILAVGLLILGFLHYTFILSDEHSFHPFPPPQSPFDEHGGPPPHLPPPPGEGPSTPSKPTPPAEWEKRADQVKEAFRRSYAAYEKYAAPYDELRPLSRMPWKNRFNGWGVNVFDSLDTMLIMGLDDEFKRGLEVVRATNYTMRAGDHAPYFETVIRYLGGLLSAYEISKEPLLLQRAEELAIALDPVFNTTSGLPTFGVNTVTGAITPRFTGVLAEIGTLQLEYTYLAKLTGHKRWYDRVKRVTEVYNNASLRDTGGMLPSSWVLSSGRPSPERELCLHPPPNAALTPTACTVQLSLGGTADSGHEYLLKQYLLTGKTDKTYLEHYIRATTQSIAKLLYISPTRNMVYATDASGFSDQNPNGYVSHKFEHLTCFFPGLLALGAHTLPLDNLGSLGINLRSLGVEYGAAKKGYEKLSNYNLKEVHMWAAEAIAQTCYTLYVDQPTGLAPDEVYVRIPRNVKPVQWLDALDNWKKSGSRGSPPGTGPIRPVTSGADADSDYQIRKWDYLLRPETIESLFVMWRVTGDPIWRERGWKIFEAIERSARTDEAYASVARVTTWPPMLANEMPSFFFAETLKYLYLMMKNGDDYNLDEWVFNTEAHPFRVFEWTEEERRTFEV